MVNRVVSTKLTEEEHSKILEICNDNGITVSRLLKRALLDRIKKEEKEKKRLTYDLKSISKKRSTNNISEFESIDQEKYLVTKEEEKNHEERFLFY